MPHPRLTNDEIARRGEEIYQQRLLPMMEPDHQGRFLVVDVETGEYEVGDDYGRLLDELQTRHEEAALYVKRIGYPAAFRIGGQLRTSDTC